MNLEVRAYPLAEPKGRTKGFASVTIDGMFCVHGISIVDGQNGLFVSMPQTKDAKGSAERCGTDETPWWRTLKKDGELNEKYPEGIDGQKLRLEMEGHTVIQKGKRYSV